MNFFEAKMKPGRERPILFNGEMVRAILDGRKTQTRRVIKPQPWMEYPRIIGPEEYHCSIEVNGMIEEGPLVYGVYDEDGEWGVKSPYGKPGDQLWVRETFFHADEEYHYEHNGITMQAVAITAPEVTVYKADNEYWDPEALRECGMKWRPSIHMPRWASRIQLLIKDVRVERVQDIGIQDAISEGIAELTKDDVVKKYAVLDKGDYSSIPWSEMALDPRIAFAGLWQDMNAKRGFGWDTNPWVWVVEFERIK